MEEMSQFRVYYIYIWKCHNETLCITFTNKNVLRKNEVQEGKTSPVQGLGTRGSREGYKEKLS
jgi:hypothetical protein